MQVVRSHPQRPHDRADRIEREERGDDDGDENPQRVTAAATGRPRCGNCHLDLPWLADAGDDTFAEVAERAAVPVLVDLWAPWCGPCCQVSPALEQVARELAGRLKLVKVNVGTAPQLSQRFSVQAVPTLMVLRDGQVVARQAGAAPAHVLRRWVDDALGSRR